MVSFPRLYIAETGYYDSQGRREIGVYAAQNIPALNPVTEYGRVLQSRKETKSLQVEDRRWIRTLNFQSVDIDGNPNHPVNGGYFGLSQTHCVGSLLNHSRQNAKCVYDKKDFLRSRFLISTDNTAIIGCIFIKTTYDIQVHEQLLIDYEPSTAKSIENLLPFV